MDHEEHQKVRKRLAEAQDDLGLVQERIWAYVTTTDVPMELLKDRLRLERELTDLKRKLGIHDDEPGRKKRDRRSQTWLVPTLVGLVVGVVVGIMFAMAALRPDTVPAESLTDPIVPIAHFPFTVSAYGSDTDPQFGSGRGILTVINQEGSDASYRLQPDIAQENEGYAVLAFSFPEPQDMTMYAFLEVTISFEREAYCDLNMTDWNENRDYIFRLGDREPIGENILVRAEGKKQTIRIPLNPNFTDSDLNLKLIAAIEFSTRLNHNVVVHDVLFIKEMAQQ